MEKVYKYPVTISQLIVGLPIVGSMVVLGTVLLVASRNLEDLPDRLVAMGLGLLFLLFFLWWFVLALMRSIGAIYVTVSDEGLVIKNVLMSQFVRWTDITEFGTYKRLAGRTFVRVYYVKTKQDTDRQIRVCNEFLDDINGLIDGVFRKARNARFLRIENSALIPFTKKLRIIPWERDSEMTS